MAADISSSNRDRGGVSLLEVLISIGVLSVGMLGAATMLPLAKFYSTEASKFDRASTLGQQAYHDLQIRGYLSIKKWLKPDIPGLNYKDASAMLIDPLAWSYAAANGTPIPNYFPAFPNNGVTPPLASAPIIFRTNIDVNSTWNEAAPKPPANPNYLPMPYQLADRIFRANDDVLFDVPGRSDGRPTTPSGVLAPDYAGDFSWFVTVSHLPTDLSNTLDRQRYVASLVVFYKREINLNAADWPGPPAQDEPPPERIVYADFLQQPVFVNQTYPLPPTAIGVYPGGGAVMLKTIPSVGASNWLDGLKPNQYVMLSANFQTVDTTNATTGTFPKVSWYRIVSVDAGAQLNASGQMTRIVNLEGADWPATVSVGNSQIWNDADGAGGDTAFCTIANGTIAVYEDVITVNNSLIKD
jgi:hypothetical protein